MEVLSDLVIIVEILVEVDLFVAVEIVQDHQLIAAGDVNIAAHNLEAQRLKEAARDPLPGERLRLRRSLFCYVALL
jgi:hypothetical protein